MSRPVRKRQGDMMKYGESVFDIAYLILAMTAGAVILSRRKDTAGRLMGAAALFLGCGDAFHLIPRVLNYFSEGDFTVWLGIGKLVTSMTMTVFYLVLFFLDKELTGEAGRITERAFIALAACRIVLCMMPGNGWTTGGGTVLWAVIRNVPFVIMGIMSVIMFYRDRNAIGALKHMWLCITLSFAFYIPVAVGAGIVPMLGMLMLPKTICYILMLVFFLRESRSTENKLT